jgi:hypothetical protein
METLVKKKINDNLKNFKIKKKINYNIIKEMADIETENKYKSVSIKEYPSMENFITYLYSIKNKENINLSNTIKYTEIKKNKKYSYLKTNHIIYQFFKVLKKNKISTQTQSLVEVLMTKWMQEKE